MDEENIIDTPDADHQHLQSIEREQKFVEEENLYIYMADIDKFDQSGQDLLTRIPERIKKSENKFDQICQDLVITAHERLQKIDYELDQICQDLLRGKQERLQKIENKLDQIGKDLLTLEQNLIQRDEQIRDYDWTCEQDIFPRPEEILEDIWTCIQEIIEKREEILEYIRTREQGIQRRETKLDQIDQDYWPLMYPGFRFIDAKLDQIDQDYWPLMYPGFQFIDAKLDQIDQDYWPLMYPGFLFIDGNFSQIDQDLWTPVQERLQKSTDKTTTTTKSRHSTITSLLLGYVFSASRFCSVGAEFIPVESDLSLCKTDLSKLTDTCDHDEGKAIYCVLNDEGEIGIGCFSKIWVKQGYCPYFRNYFGVLDIRPCLGNSSICPTDRDQYLSNEVYKYPGCLIYNRTRVLDILTSQTTESTTIRSSDAGDEESILLVLVVIIGLITLSLLLIHRLRFLRSMKITSRGLRSAYAPASMGHQHPHDLPDDGVDV